MRLTWTHPKYRPGDWVLFLNRHRNRILGQVIEIVTTYPDGRARHCYKLRPFGKRNAATVAENMVLPDGVVSLPPFATARPNSDAFGHSDRGRTHTGASA